MQQIIVGDHVVASVRNKNSGAAFLRASKKVYPRNSTDIVHGVVTQIYRNGAIALSVGSRSANVCFVNASDVINIIPRPYISRRDFNFANLNRMPGGISHGSDNQHAQNRRKPSESSLHMRKSSSAKSINSNSSSSNKNKYLFDHHIEMRQVLRGMAYQKKNKRLNLSQSLKEFNAKSNLDYHNNGRLQSSPPHTNVHVNNHILYNPENNSDHTMKSKLFLKAFQKKEVFTFQRNKFSRPKSAQLNNRKKKKKLKKRKSMAFGDNIHSLGSTTQYDENFKTPRDVEKDRLMLLSKVFTSTNNNNDSGIKNSKRQNNDKNQNLYKSNSYNFNTNDNENEETCEMRKDCKEYNSRKYIRRPRTSNSTGIYARHDGARERAFLIEARRNKLLG